MTKNALKDCNGHRLRPGDIVVAQDGFCGRTPAYFLPKKGEPLCHDISAGTMGLYEGLAPGEPELGVVSFEGPGGSTLKVEAEPNNLYIEVSA